MSQDIFIRLFKNCYQKNDFSPFQDVKKEDIPVEYEELTENIKTFLENKEEISATNLIKLTKGTSIVAKYMELCNKTDKQTYRIL